MATSELVSGLIAEKWESEFRTEYVRSSRYSSFFGGSATNDMAPFIIAFASLSDAKVMNIPFVGRLISGGVRGTKSKLVGFEEAITNSNFQLGVNFHRHAVEINVNEAEFSPAKLLGQARPRLRANFDEMLRDDLTTALMSYPATTDIGGYIGGRIYTDDTTTSLTPLEVYTAYSEATKDAWMVLNADRVLFGKLVANSSSNDHSTALLTIDTTDDKMTAAMISLAKMRANEAGQNGSTKRRITPYKIVNEKAREGYVLFVGSRGFRDLKQDSSIISANRDARPRDVDANPIFQDGDLMWDGVVIREVPEIPVLAGVGNGGSDVAPAFLCGAQAATVGWMQKPKIVTDNTTDYGSVEKIGMQECRGTAKFSVNGLQTGMVSIFHSAPPNA